MNAADVTPGLCVVLAALWSGVLLTLTTMPRPMFPRLDGPGFALEMRRILPVARRSPTKWISVIGLVLAPVAALIAPRTGTATFVLTALGLAACVVGPLLVSRFLAERNCDVILAWDPDAMRADSDRVRRRYFRLNWARAVITWTALALLAAAAYLSWG
jgi:hypothetical protein